MEGSWANSSQDYDAQLRWALEESIREAERASKIKEEKDQKILMKTSEVVAFTSDREKLQGVLKKLPGVKYDDQIFEEFYK